MNRRNVGYLTIFSILVMVILFAAGVRIPTDGYSNPTAPRSTPLRTPYPDPSVGGPSTLRP